MSVLHHEWRHLGGIANTMPSKVYPLLNENTLRSCYCPFHNIPLGRGESEMQVADPSTIRLLSIIGARLPVLYFNY